MSHRSRSAPNQADEAETDNLEDLLQAAERDITVLSCRPAETETKLAFAAPADLLAPVDDLASLPPPQQRALKVALLEIDPGPERAEPRAVGAALTNLGAGLANQAPVLIAIADSQWLDFASAAAVSFALRRLDHLPVGVLATRRTGEATRSRLELPRRA